MKWLKDLLYSRDNQAMDIARVSSLGSVIAYWVGVFAGRVGGDALAVGGGCAAIFAGAAAWIHFRQKHESAAAPAAEGEAA